MPAQAGIFIARGRSLRCRQRSAFSADSHIAAAAVDCSFRTDVDCGSRIQHGKRHIAGERRSCSQPQYRCFMHQSVLINVFIFSAGAYLDIFRAADIARQIHCSRYFSQTAGICVSSIRPFTICSCRRYFHAACGVDRTIIFDRGRDIPVSELVSQSIQLVFNKVRRAVSQSFRPRIGGSLQDDITAARIHSRRQIAGQTRLDLAAVALDIDQISKIDHACAQGSSFVDHAAAVDTHKDISCAQIDLIGSVDLT